MKLHLTKTEEKWPLVKKVVYVMRARLELSAAEEMLLKTQKKLRRMEIMAGVRHGAFGFGKWKASLGMLLDGVKREFPSSDDRDLCEQVLNQDCAWLKEEFERLGKTTTVDY